MTCGQIRQGLIISLVPQVSLGVPPGFAVGGGESGGSYFDRLWERRRKSQVWSFLRLSAFRCVSTVRDCAVFSAVRSLTSAVAIAAPTQRDGIQVE